MWLPQVSSKIATSIPPNDAGSLLKIAAKSDAAKSLFLGILTILTPV